MKVLLLSAYAAQSHRYWQRGLREMFPAWRWTELELPPRYFSWRVRSNPLSWSLTERATLEADYDLLIATSMVDLATLRGLVPNLARLPSLLYFHENQFVYPQDRQQHSLLEAQMVSLYAALAADQLLFNSAYNRDTFLTGVAGLLSKMPDEVPPGVADRLAGKAGVLPVPLLDTYPSDASLPWPGRQGEYPDRPLRLLWSARFEHDKGGEDLEAILQGLETTNLDYELAVTGQQFRNSPAVFTRVEQAFAHRLVSFGFVENEADFRALQGGADVVLSTAGHEFQGLAVLEAVLAGSVPLVPDRLAYPEIYPPELRYDSPEDAVALVLSLAHILTSGQRPNVALERFTVAALQPCYAAILTALAATAG
ncbi:hypothetical protein A3709_17825 [Halioglobus sp. HI00S01]|uniref:tRNA-queuosine alpha-mannosyltransferase domain-containing protein n=1 Tax=Halioglobus sp. HI00S01 TaxID=1822214 RepID=UPI0007C2DEC2|nr:DUF3524 domain-containing protein [Halioglobus sp. HI00S01]KZX58845.1 hypothetical protein A3709_17825 [Halioglobus sp. HI00S01]